MPPALVALSRAGRACICPLARAVPSWAVGASPSWGSVGIGHGDWGRTMAGVASAAVPAVAAAAAGARVGVPAAENAGAKAKNRGVGGKGSGGSAAGARALGVPQVAPRKGRGAKALFEEAMRKVKFTPPRTQRTEFYYWRDLRAMMMHALNLTDPRKVPELVSMKITCTQNDIIESGPKKAIPALLALLLLSGGQRPNILRAKTSNNRWGVREGAVMGGTVTVRGRRMYDALEIVVNAMLPALRDFKGISDSKISSKGATLAFGITSGTAAPQLNAHPFMFEGKVTGFLIELSMKNCRGKEDAVILLRGLQVPIVPATKADLAKKNPSTGWRGR